MWEEYHVVPSYFRFTLKMSAANTTYALKSNICNILEDVAVANVLIKYLYKADLGMSCQAKGLTQHGGDRKVSSLKSQQVKSKGNTIKKKQTVLETQRVKGNL